jgi:hypothetical protein
MGNAASSPPPLEQLLEAVGFCGVRRAKTAPSEAVAPSAAPAWVRCSARPERSLSRADAPRAQEAEREALQADVAALRGSLDALQQARELSVQRAFARATADAAARFCGRRTRSCRATTRPSRRSWSA